MLITASQVDRFLACPGSATRGLPVFGKDSGASEYGNAVHDVMARAVAAGGFIQPIDAQPERHREALRKENWRAVVDACGGPFAFKAARTELCIVGRVDGGALRDVRVIAEAAGRRDYGHAEDYADGLWLGGTLDYLSGRYVRDYKSGGGYLPPARESGQLLAQAALAMALTGLDAVHVGFVRIFKGSVYYECDNVDAMDTAALLYNLSQAAQSDRINEGGHCKYCPSWKSCPVKLAPLPDKPAIVDEASAVEAYRLMRRAGEVADGLQADLKEYVENYGPLDIGGGMVYDKTSSGFREVRRG